MSHLTLRHKLAFNAVTSGDFINFALMACTVNGESSAAIVAVTKDGDFYDLAPLFVVPTPKMELMDDGGQRCIIADLEGGQACADAS